MNKYKVLSIYSKTNACMEFLELVNHIGVLQEDIAEGKKLELYFENLNFRLESDIIKDIHCTEDFDIILFTNTMIYVLRYMDN